MSNEEIVRLIQQGQDRKQNEELLFRQNRGLIVNMAWKFRGYAEKEDLVQEGYFGLMEAVSHYDPAGGASFATYALYWIRQTMTRYCEDNSTLIRLPSYQRSNLIKYSRCCDLFEKMLNRKPTDLEASAYMKTSVRQVEEIRRNMVLINSRSFSEVIGGEDDDITLGDVIPDETNYMASIIDDMARKSMRKEIRDSMTVLTGQEAAVLRGRFVEYKTLQEISRDLSVSRERIRKVEESALRKLRKAIEKTKSRELFEEYVRGKVETISYNSSGLNAFRNSFTSAPEAAVMFIESKEENHGFNDGNN